MFLCQSPPGSPVTALHTVYRTVWIWLQLDWGCLSTILLSLATVCCKLLDYAPHREQRNMKIYGDALVALGFFCIITGFRCDCYNASTCFLTQTSSKDHHVLEIKPFIHNLVPIMFVWIICLALVLPCDRFLTRPWRTPPLAQSQPGLAPDSLRPWRTNCIDDGWTDGYPAGQKIINCSQDHETSAVP